MTSSKQDNVSLIKNESFLPAMVYSPNLHNRTGKGHQLSSGYLEDTDDVIILRSREFEQTILTPF